MYVDIAVGITVSIGDPLSSWLPAGLHVGKSFGD